MKLGPLYKRDNRNITTTKKVDKGVMLANYDVISNISTYS